MAAPRTINLEGALSASDLAAIAVVTNPDLKALRAREGVASAQVFAAGLLPDPAISAGFDTPLNGQGLVSAIAGSLGYDSLALMRQAPLSRRTEADLKAVREDIAWIEWLTAQQARLLAVRVVYLRKIRAQTRGFRALSDTELMRALHATGRGDLAPAALETRRIAATDAADRDRAAESQLRIAELDLNRLLGIDPASELNLGLPELDRPQLATSEDLFKRAVTNRADLAALRANYEGTSADIALARLGGFPAPSLSLNAARDTGKIRSIGPNVSLTLPIWNRGRGDIAVAEASQKVLHAEYVARLEQVRADIAAARAAYEIANRQAADVANELAPLEPQADAADRAAERGDISQSAADATRLALIDKQIILTSLKQAEMEFLIALEIAAGPETDQ